MADKTWSSLNKGEYSALTAYTVGDFVSYEGGYYTCIQNTTGNAPTTNDDNAYWNLVASKGDTGATGSQGIQGIQGETGEVGATWKGDWSAVTTYVVDDIVYRLGSSYICILGNTNQEPPNATYWNLLAQKGLDGEGAGDVIGPASAIGNNLVAFDSTTGKIIKDSGTKPSDFATTTVLGVEHNVDGTHKFAGLTAKTTPVDADLVPLVDSEATNVLKKLTWANFKTVLASYLASLTETLTNKTLTSPTVTSPTITGTPVLNADSAVPFYNDSMSRQAIMNGDGQVSQRATTFVAGANNDDVYTLDRWNLISDGNDVFDVSQEATEVPDGAAYSIKLDVETAKRGGIVQFLENKDAKKFKGKSVSVSFSVKSANIAALRCAVLSWGSTADAVTSDVVGTWAATPTWAANWTAENTPADLTVTTGWTTVKVENIAVDSATVNNLALVIWTPNEETIGDIVYITNVQMNEGAVALPFQPKSYEEELRACQRYLFSAFDLAVGNYAAAGMGKATSTTSATVFVHLPVPLRALPTLVTSGTLRLDEMVIYGVTVTSLAIASLASMSGNKVVSLVAGVASGLTAKDVVLLQRGNNTTATLFLDSEL